MAGQVAHDALEMVEYREIPSLLVIGDGEPVLAEAAALAERSGYRLVDTVALEDAQARLERQVALDGVLLSLERDHGEQLDRLIERLGFEAAGGRFGSVICAPAELIDAVAARAAHRRLFHLCEPKEDEIRSALAEAVERRPAMLHDVGKKQPPPRLQQLSEEVGRIASVLAALSEEEQAAMGAAAQGKGEPIRAGQIRALIRARRMRDHYFRGELFADPAWDMLLDLFAARLEEQRVAVSSLCIAAAVPPTTALRWIKTLTDEGLVVRIADPEDGRRVFIQLSDAAAGSLEAYFRTAQRISPLAI